MIYPAPVWSEIDLDALGYNVRQLRNATDTKAELMAVVKADAYGHGAKETAATALKYGASWLGVARVSEGIALRQAGIEAPILVLGYTVREELPLLLAYELIQTVFNLNFAEELAAVASRAAKKALVHIKVDTGMGRLGFLPDSYGVRDMVKLAGLNHLDVQGIFTHFAASDSADKSYTNMQWRKFIQLLELLHHKGLSFLCRHAANSAALLDMPETHLDMVRAGIALYGVKPSSELVNQQVKLKPVMSVKSKIAQIKKVSAGCGISYGTTYITPAQTRVATIPAGYADGYNRLLSSKGEVLICGKRAPVIGRVCMDQFMADVGHIPEAEPGAEVVLLGKQGEEAITADEIAAKIDTIAYEVLCAVNSRRVVRNFISTHKVV